ncbi:prolyl oligopeptidase family serine peptidase [Sinomicrobium sp. M5D2P17]
MKSKLFILLCSPIFLVHCTKNKPGITAPVKEVSETLYGMEVTDPYRYMENPEDSTVIQWYKAQEIRTRNILGTIPGNTALQEKINGAAKPGSFTVSDLKVTDNDYYFYLKKTPETKVARLYYRKGFDGSENELFDPTEYKSEAQGTCLINYIKPNWDGSRIVIGLTRNDEEFADLLALEVRSGRKILEVHGHNSPTNFGGVQWLPDSSGFIYTYVPVTDTKSDNYLLNTGAVVYRPGQDPTDPQYILSAKHHPALNIDAADFPMVYYTNPKNRYALGIIAGGGKYRDLYYTEVARLSGKEKVTWTPLFHEEDMTRKYLLKDNELYFLSVKNAPHGKICKTILGDTNVGDIETLVEADTTAIITDYAVTKNELFYVKTKNGVEARLYRTKEGSDEEIALPKPSGSINLDAKGTAYDELWIEVEGWTNNKTRYRYNNTNGTFTAENLSPVVTYPELKDVVVEEIEIPSHDGVMVPLSIIYKKDLVKNGKNRMLINGYGAFRWSNSPYLYPYLLHWVSEGGVYAVAHIRGGGEKGDAWHKAGFKATKSNTWKDFIACTEYLIDEGYTSREKTAAWGASGGGINIARAITERPDLFAAAVIRVGVINTLRSEFAHNGPNIARELGTVKDSVEFKALLEMDACHHVKDGVKYPAVLLTAGMNDARVPAWHSGKFAAHLLAATASDRPVLLSIDFEGGHGFDASKGKKNAELANILSFLFWQTGHEDYQK